MSGPSQDQINSYIVSPIPFNEYAISSGYGYRTLYKKRRFHGALDIRALTSIENPVPIVAMADGTVTYSNFAKVGGQQIIIKHEAKTGMSKTIYCHLVQDSPSRYGIEKGVKVKKGQVIGIMGSTGSADRRRHRKGGRHLHLEAFDINGKKFDLNSLFQGFSVYVRKTKKGTKVYVSKQKRDDEAAILADAKDKVEKYGLELVPGGGVGNAELEEISDEEVKASIMGFFLPRIIKERQKNIALAKDDGIIRLRTKNRTPYAHNMVLSKIDQSRYSDFSLLTTNEISNLVPFVEIYLINKLKNNKENHVLFPFDDYSQKTKIENIFYDKTGRGGNIGVKSVDWKTIGTNFSNVNQVTVNIKIHIQDIQDIETKRNGVSLLDLLYPAGTRNNEYDDKNFNIKLKLGWLYKMNPSLASLNNKLDEKLLQENIFVSLYKHDFEFNEAGSVTLSLEYIGMLESKISNPHKYDVLDLLAPERRTKKQDLNKILSIKELIDKITNAKTEEQKRAFISRLKAREDELQEYNITIEGNILKTTKQITVPRKVFIMNKDGTEKVSYRQEMKDKTYQLDLNDPDSSIWASIKEVFTKTGQLDLSEEVKEEEKELAQSYLKGLQNLLNHLSENNLIKAFTLTTKEKEELKDISLLENATLTQEQIEKYLDSQDLKFQESTDDQGSKIIPKANINEALADEEIVKYSDKNIAIDKEKMLEALLEENELAVPYTFLGEIISYFNKLFFNNNDAKANKEFRVVLGDFSYRDIGMTQDDKNSADEASARPKIQEEYVSLDGKIRYKYGLEKKYASLADIPISIESLLGWYNEHVADTGIEKLSYNSFLKSIFNNLVPANLTNQILDIGIGTKRKILTSFSYLDIQESKNIEKKLIKQNGSRYELDFSKNTSKNAFYKIKARSNITKSSNIPMQNYIFIFSTNEYEYSQLKGNYISDKSKDVFHFYVGEDRGTIKNIKFSREDNPGLDSANILKANSGNSDQAIIRRIYQSDITLYGNTIFSPGQLIFIAPTYPGARLRNKTLQQVGIGGYYRIIEIQSFIEDGKFETVLKTKWQASGLGVEQETDSLTVQADEQEEEYGQSMEEEYEQSMMTEEQLADIQTSYETTLKVVYDEQATLEAQKRYAKNEN